MSITIGSNIASLQAQRKLGTASETVSSIFERMSSGQRINKASDDAAGLAISSSLNLDVRVYSQASRNINDGISLLNIAQGVLSELSNITTRQMELAEQSANGVYNLQQRRVMQNEANTLVDEFNRIVQSTKFNGINLLDGSFASGIRIQGGFGLNGSLAFSLGRDMGRYVNDFTFLAPNGIPGGPNLIDQLVMDVNGDGKKDLITAARNANEVRVLLGNGDGTFLAAKTNAVTFGGQGSMTFGDMNGDGIQDLVVVSGAASAVNVMFGNGNGSYLASVTYYSGGTGTGVNVGDVNNDGRLDIITSAHTNTDYAVLLNNGNGTFKSFSGPFNSGTNINSGSLGDVNQDGILDLLFDNYLLLGNGDGTFRAGVSLASGAYSKLADINGDGILDVASVTGIVLGNGNGTFKALQTVSLPGALKYLGDPVDVSGDGTLDLFIVDRTSGVMSLFTGNRDGTFKWSASLDFPTSRNLIPILADLNNDGVIDLVPGENSGTANNIQVYLGNGTLVTTTPYLNLITQQTAKETLPLLQATLERLNKEIGTLGAAQSRLQVGLNTVQVMTENEQASKSRILDADMAEETSNLIRTQILQQAGVSVLANANQLPALALSLLR